MSKKLLSGPYLLWMAAFTIIPLGLIVYYGLTDRTGVFTLENILSIATPEHRKALFLSLGLSICSTAICLILAYPLAMHPAEAKYRERQFYCVHLHSSHVDEFPFTYTGMADASGEKRRHQRLVKRPASACPVPDQHSRSHRSGYGI